jgi:hypothetical protein
MTTLDGVLIIVALVLAGTIIASAPGTRGWIWTCLLAVIFAALVAA